LLEEDSKIFNAQHRIALVDHRVAIRAKWNKVYNRIYLVYTGCTGQLLLAMMNMDETSPKLAVYYFEIE
jgi:hypothetical protein